MWRGCRALAVNGEADRDGQVLRSVLSLRLSSPDCVSEHRTHGVVPCGTESVPGPNPSISPVDSGFAA